MKKQLLSSLALGLMTFMMIGCSKPADKSDAKSNAGKTSKVSTSKHTHTFNNDVWASDDETHWHPATCEHTDARGGEEEHEFVKDTTTSVDATCAKAGKLVEKCKCGKTRETVIPADANHHTWGAPTTTVTKSDTTSAYEIKECTTCHSIALEVKADSYLEIDGSLKSVPDGDTSVKLSKNGNYTKYNFNLPRAFTNADVYLYGWVDHFTDSNNNGDKGNINGGAPTFKLEVGTTEIEVTDTRTFKECGMVDSGLDDGQGNTRGTNTMCLLGGKATLAAGDIELTYTRLASYNLNVLSFYFIVPQA